MGPQVGRVWRPVMPEERILMTEWSHDLQYFPSTLTWAKQTVKEAQSNQSAGHVKP